MLLDTQYQFTDTHTVLTIEGLRIVYVLAQNLIALRDEVFDHAFVLYCKGNKPTVDWRKLKDKDRATITLKEVRRPSSYLNGCALLMPHTFRVEREEILVRVEEDHIARLFSYSVGGKLFVPHHLRERVLSHDEKQACPRSVLEQPLIDISIMPNPSREHSKDQMALL